MRTIEQTFTTKDGSAHHYTGWLPDRVSRVLVIQHGLGEYGARYSHVAGTLVSRGYAVYAKDARGHGGTSKLHSDLGYFERIDTLVEDLRAFIGHVASAHPDGGKPFLFAHSMGGLLALRYATQYQDEIRALALSAPWLDAATRVPMPMYPVIRLLSRIAPRFGLAAIDARTLSRDPAVAQALATDPYAWKNKVPARIIAEAIDAAEKVYKDAPTLKLPVLLMHGSADGLVGYGGSEKLFPLIGSSDKTFKRWDDFYHELVNEPEKEQVIDTLVAWFAAH